MKQPTKRQIEIVQGIANGLTSVNIGDLLGLNFRTIEKASAALRVEYGAVSSCNLVAIFFRKKFIQ